MAPRKRRAIHKDKELGDQEFESWPQTSITVLRLKYLIPQRSNIGIETSNACKTIDGWQELIMPQARMTWTTLDSLLFHKKNTMRFETLDSKRLVRITPLDFKRKIETI